MVATQLNGGRTQVLGARRNLFADRKSAVDMTGREPEKTFFISTSGAGGGGERSEPPAAPDSIPSIT